MNQLIFFLFFRVTLKAAFSGWRRSSITFVALRSVIARNFCSSCSAPFPHNNNMSCGWKFKTLRWNRNSRYQWQEWNKENFFWQHQWTELSFFLVEFVCLDERSVWRSFWCPEPSCQVLLWPGASRSESCRNVQCVGAWRLREVVSSELRNGSASAGTKDETGFSQGSRYLVK